jgi:hypothetical protein
MKGKKGVIYQLPLVVSSQQIAACCRCSIKSKICPSPSPSTVFSLQLDAATIYNLIRSIGDGHKVLKKDEVALSSERDAVWNKNYVFGSVFSLQKIYQLCRLYNIQFIYNIMVRPGLKTCSVLGESTNAEGVLSKREINGSRKAKGLCANKCVPKSGHRKRAQLSKKTSLSDERGTVYSHLEI